MVMVVTGEDGVMMPVSPVGSEGVRRQRVEAASFFPPMGWMFDKEDAKPSGKGDVGAMGDFGSEGLLSSEEQGVMTAGGGKRRQAQRPGHNRRRSLRLSEKQKRRVGGEDQDDDAAITMSVPLLPPIEEVEG